MADIDAARSSFITNLVYWIMVTATCACIGTMQNNPYAELARYLAAGGLGGLVMLGMVVIIGRSYEQL